MGGNGPYRYYRTTSLAHQALEIALKNELIVYGLFSEGDQEGPHEINHILILGNLTDPTTDLEKLGKDGAIFVALESTASRKSYIKQLSAYEDPTFINLVHPSANITFQATLGNGNLVGAYVSMGAHSQLGNHCIVHPHVILEYGAQVQNFVQIGAGSIIGEQVVIEEDVFIGPGSTLIAGIRIGKGARIGAGSVVLASVKAHEVVLGNPAKPFQHI
eukprot:gene758-939_t